MPLDSPPAEDIPQHHTEKPLLQRFCTRARMRLRHADVARRMALLRHDEPLREAFDLDIPPDFFTTIPDARFKYSSLDVPTMVACYMGLEDPLLVEHRTMYSRTGTRHGEEQPSFALWIRMAARFRSTLDQGTRALRSTTRSRP